MAANVTVDELLATLSERELSCVGMLVGWGRLFAHAEPSLRGVAESLMAKGLVARGSDGEFEATDLCRELAAAYDEMAAALAAYRPKLDLDALFERKDGRRERRRFFEPSYVTSPHAHPAILAHANHPLKK